MTKLTTVSPHFVSMITYIKRSLNLITPVALDATNGGGLAVSRKRSKVFYF